MLALPAGGHRAEGGLRWEADRGCRAGGSRLGPRVLLAHQGRGLAVSLSSPVFAAQPPALLSHEGRGHGTPDPQAVLTLQQPLKPLPGTPSSVEKTRAPRPTAGSQLEGWVPSS